MTDHTMIERMARAFLKAGPDEMAYVGDGGERSDPLDCMTIDGDVDLIAGMRAVLTAMREPTIEMILSCADIPWSQQDMWKRSIDAVLAEQPQ